MAVTVPRSEPAKRESRESADNVRWIVNAGADLAMHWSWVPFALLAMAMAGHQEWLRALMYGTFLFSFAHQPLTLCLVYGDPARFDLRRKLFTWSPIVFLLAVVIALDLNPLVLALIGGLWNAEHTLMQRYGITRIYGRMAGQSQGGIELPMLFVWLLLAAIWAAGDPATPERISALGLGGSNRRAFDALTQLKPYAEYWKPVFLFLTAVCSVVWLNAEARRSKRSPAKYYYLGSTAMLFAVLLVNPIAGYVGYVGSHAFEYFFIVNRALGQYQRNESGGAVGTWVRMPAGRLGFLLAYLVVILGTVVLLEWSGSRYAYSLVFFTVGALHFWYDTFIWKLRSAPVAASVGAELPGASSR